MINISGWWFGTLILFFHIYIYIGNVIIPTDEVIFFRGVDIHQPEYLLVNSPGAPKSVNVPCCFVRVRRQKLMDLTLQIAWGYVPRVYWIYLRVRV